MSITKIPVLKIDMIVTACLVNLVTLVSVGKPATLIKKIITYLKEKVLNEMTMEMHFLATNWRSLRMIYCPHPLDQNSSYLSSPVVSIIL